MFGHFFAGFDPDQAEDCENMHSLPNVNFHVIGEKGVFDLILEPKDYVIKYTDSNGENETCIMGISPDDEVDYLITIG